MQPHRSGPLTPIDNHETMILQPPLTYRELDWNQLWKNAREQKSWQSKKVEDWDSNARAFAARTAESPYASLVLSRLPLDDSMTVLDIGAGPGTLALPLARRVASVTAVDFSQRMLEVLAGRARDGNLTNIRTVKCAWEDDWDEAAIGVHDMVIASRSLGVDDLRAALKKLNDHAGRFAIITDRIAPAPFDPAAFKAVGRPFDSGPDYIYTLNMLYSMGIHPAIDILELERDLVFPDLDKALEIYTWMFKDLSAEESVRLRDYVASLIVESDTSRIIIRREFPPRWAMIRWQRYG